MGRIGIFLERSTIASGDEMNALMRFSQVARRLGHRADFLFRPDLFKIPDYDAIYIRALTDPLNAAYAASRMAEMHGVRVFDDPDSIRICCDKISMYRHLMAAGVPIPQTIFLEEQDLTIDQGGRYLEELGNPLVMKAPNSSFSMYVDRVTTPKDFVEVGKRFLRRSDRLVMQRFVRSTFDWRIGVLGGEPLYACQYVIPRRQWKILTYTPEKRPIAGPVRGISLEKADQNLLDRAVEAARAVGDGLYGVDLKQVNGEYLVIEVNDNPTILGGDEDQMAGGLYERLVRFLMKDEQ